MYEMLGQYLEDSSVGMVTGYSYPVDRVADERSNAVKQNFEGSIWGGCIWETEREKLCSYLRKGLLIRQFSPTHRGGNFERMAD